MSQTTRFLLIDNGSYRPEATLNLRRLAAELTAATGHQVDAVSLLHSGKIDQSKLGGTPALTFEPFLRSHHQSSWSNFVVVPLFFGPSAAAYEFLPQRVEVVRNELDWHDLEVRVGPALVDPSDAGDSRVAKILADSVRSQISLNSLDQPAVALCDHGAPRIGVTEVRNFLAIQLAKELGDTVSTVQPASMERRPDPAYAFNEPLLENLLLTPEFSRQVVVSMLFFQPGRHAGPEGDVSKICAEAKTSAPNQEAHMTELVGTHPGLIPILAERLQQALNSAPIEPQ